MIYTAEDVKTVCNAVLQAAFPSMTVYGNDTLDGYKRPSFFTELLSHGRTKTSRYLTQIGFTYRITYFEEIHDEAACLDIYEAICKAFEPAIKVKGHVRLFVRTTDYDWIDENSDKLQVTISFYDVTELGGYSTDGLDIMKDLTITTTESEG